MEEIKIKAIIINSTDYKDKHKLINAFSLEFGKFSAILKNCKNINSKLKFCYSPFCFLELELFKMSDMFVVKNATIIDDFFALSENYDNYISASAMLEIVNKCFKQNEANNILFISLLKSFKALVYNNINPKLVLAKFLMGTTKISGFKFNFNSCSICRFPFLNYVYLNLNSGELECEACKQNFSIKIENKTFKLLKQLSNTDIDNLNIIQENEEEILKTIKILSLNLENRLNLKFNFNKYYI